MKGRLALTLTFLDNFDFQSTLFIVLSTQTFLDLLLILFMKYEND